MKHKDKKTRRKGKMSKESKVWYRFRNVIRIKNVSNCTVYVEVIKPSEHIPSTKSAFGYFEKGGTVIEETIIRSRAPLYQEHETEISGHKMLRVHIYVGCFKTYTADLNRGDIFRIQSQHLEPPYDITENDKQIVPVRKNESLLCKKTLILTAVLLAVCGILYLYV